MKIRLLFAGLVLSAFTANAQLATLNENFESAVVSTPANYNNMVNGWTNKKVVDRTVYIDQATGNKYLQFYAGGSAATDVFLISPQIVAPDGTKQLAFTATPTAGSTLEVGLIDDPATLTANSGVPASYQLLQTYVFSDTNTPVITPFTIPASSKQYIVFRFRNPQLMGSPFPPPGPSHAALAIDNIVYNTAGNLSVSDDAFTKNNAIKFAVNTQNTALQFVGKVQPKTVEIYSAAGQQVAAGKVSSSNFDISTLQSGVYYIFIETTDDKAVKSKFIKK
ncbi:T9SS type A sorting domain-containing protein [Chryseobacterium sp. C-71]|uniref:T9SS type A sorting domain-containing protein n=1 Tax=Chryseobacterium sp. C-71 TaxID=2893882 RepID=UPI001E41B67D|nr:T9SS type A sorting domain-containing protein [Chryseobacterium sp. C-71]UFH32051.1 T9SS type A sorting domain-containing protein [Chryseobacterium sp. C-71]